MIDADKKAPSPCPPYYAWHPVAECRQITEHFPANLAQALAYIWRTGRKGGPEGEIADLKKAQAFLGFQLDKRRRELGL